MKKKRKKKRNKKKNKEEEDEEEEEQLDNIHLQRHYCTTKIPALERFTG